jgi:hypothetical protein
MLNKQARRVAAGSATKLIGKVLAALPGSCLARAAFICSPRFRPISEAYQKAAEAGARSLDTQVEELRSKRTVRLRTREEECNGAFADDPLMFSARLAVVRAARRTGQALMLVAPCCSFTRAGAPRFYRV